MGDMEDKEVLEAIRSIVGDSEARLMERISDAFSCISVNDQHCRTRHETIDKSIAIIETVIKDKREIDNQKPQLWQGWGALAGIFIGIAAFILALLKK